MKLCVLGSGRRDDVVGANGFDLDMGYGGLEPRAARRAVMAR
ncbi:MAG: hypothetical protein Q7S20_01605 [Gemmatimonadaceae bacterium]|nr:hypothetical protein [Gemmatimonadaceae bacterium]